jgi:hypothetical protein
MTGQEITFDYATRNYTIEPPLRRQRPADAEAATPSEPAS